MFLHLQMQFLEFRRNNIKSIPVPDVFNFAYLHVEAGTVTEGRDAR